MSRNVIRLFMCSVVVFLNQIGNAADAVVQEFEGWKITIQANEGDLPRKAIMPNPAVFEDLANNLTPRFGPILKLTSFNPFDEAQISKAPMPNQSSELGGPPALVAKTSSDPAPRASADPSGGPADPRFLSRMYLDVYKSIPFVRAEYEANPSYVHDATMEFLFGHMRPTVIHRNTISLSQNSPHYGSGFRRYAYPPLQLIVPGTGLRIHRSD